LPDEGKTRSLSPVGWGRIKDSEGRCNIVARGTRPTKSDMTHFYNEESVMDPSNLITPELQAELIEFSQSLVRIKSISGQEEQAIRLIETKMHALGYDQVIIDSMGNLVGRIGQGDKTILFDSHVDTVEVNDAEKWDFPPFSGALVDGRLHGRGSVDMKSGAAASIYAGALAHRLGLDSGKTVYVSCGVFEEDCDGENLKHLFKELNLKPDNVMICEPSNNQIALGHKGKAQISIKTHGVSAHGSAPEKGLNAIYEMAEIIQRVEKANAELMKKNGLKPTLVISRISSTSASLNAVPSECEAYLDRRMVPGETQDAIRQEMDQLILGKNASWEVGTIYRKSWTGMEIKYQPFHLAWKIDLDHQLARACIAAYTENFGRRPAEYGFWDFSTDAVTPVSMGIPTIGFGPGEPKLAHMGNESCPIHQIIEACGFYTRLIQKI
jgi:putative selenium metabolism hydrolase